MSPLLAKALEDARSLAVERGWHLPDGATLAEAERLLELVGREWRAPQVQAEPDGALTLEWDAGARGWLQLSVRGQGQLAHSAVIEGDEYTQSEAFSDGLPGWADALLRKLLLVGH
jgi:hypothetical protein